jgi:hypothetical protein
MTKDSIIRLLQKLARSPLHRRQLGSDVRANARVLRDEPFPKGLRGLIEETIVPTGFNSICKIEWKITKHGQDLLEALRSNSDAMPPKGIGMSARERAQRDAECNAERMKEKMAENAARHSRRLKHERRLRNPKHTCRDYDQEPTSSITDTSSPDFKRLSSLERIRILRHQCGSSRPKDVISNEWTKDEMDLLNQSLHPEKRTHEMPKVQTSPSVSTSSFCLSDEAQEEWNRNAQQIAEWHERMNAELKKLGLK